MTKNFDEARQARAEADRSFVIGGETFVRKVGVRPEVIAAYDAIDAEGSPSETLNSIDSVILDMVEDTDDAHKRYRALRERAEDPITLADLTDLVAWLIEEETGRTPTRQPSSSPAGPPRRKTTTT